jgi:transposase
LGPHQQAGERLAYHYTTEENGLVLRRYWTNACQSCAIKQSCTTGKERRITRWEHEHILEAVQRRLDEHPEKMRQRRETVEHPFGTIKARMGATHFLMKTLPRVAFPDHNPAANTKLKNTPPRIGNIVCM